MKPIAKLILLGAVCVIMLSPRHAKGQTGGILDETTLGRSQNDGRDLANSLTGTPQKFGKGEKKEQVNTAELKSKTTKDSTFGGSLLNMGIVGAEPKLDEQHKAHNAAVEEAKPSKQSKVDTAKDSNQSAPVEQQQSFSNLSDTANLAESLGQSNAEASDESKVSNSTGASATRETQDKQQRSTSSSADEKPPAASTEKSPAAKPDGGH